MLLVPADYGGRQKPPWLGFGAMIRHNIVSCTHVATEIDLDPTPFDAYLYRDEHDINPIAIKLALLEDDLLEMDSVYEGVLYEVLS